ncbi:sialidase-1 [Flagellimonas taeanensis]|uniref:exo-alpha-sialidase n=1 Tax=Flagellimonas taeanensis TaxID=1005926 RepID=A0A1M7APH9_9FLAO|nr:sialidase family protein [Allomuricauda taeanensis]SFC35084.1 sialidase-1 [Allomuricauda taeanensis]SHL44621.1 sialidase-1 [Allomuricauda taeanensis]
MNRLIYSLLFLFVLMASCQKAPYETSHTKMFNWPVLKNKSDNPVLRISFPTPNDTVMEADIEFKISHENIETLKTIRLYASGKDSMFTKEAILVGETIPAEETKFDLAAKLENGPSYYWLTYELQDKADLTQTVKPVLREAKVNGTQLAISSENSIDKLRLGVALRQHGQDGVHTYRIPGLTTSNEGTLIAIYDVRRDLSRDLQGNIDIGVSRSFDQGNTWNETQVALDMGTYGNLPEKFNGVSDACILVDERTGTIFIAGLWMHGVINKDGQWLETLNEESDDWNHQWRNKGSQPGLDIKQTSQFLITKSTDNGETWEEPINLTPMIKDPKWWLFAPAPGHGITLDDGTLVFPTQGRDSEGLPFSNITYSKDGGKTWVASQPAAKNTTECMVVQLSNGSLMLNMRYNANRKNFTDTNGREIAVTHDLGQTWAEHPTSNNALIEPVCMASIHKHYYTDDAGNKKGVLLFSNPNSKESRVKQTIKISFDDGQTWPSEHWIELDEGRGAGYSCLTSIDEDKIGILYEGSQAQMTFQTVLFEEILNGDNK